MREILFRGKRVDNGEWVEGYYIKSPEFDGEGVSVITVDKPRMPYYVNNETVGQYTGLCDKKGKKIFEGDIFRPFDNEIIVVAWIDYYSTLGFLCRIEHTETKRGKEITESHDGWAMLCDYELSELEIIGNIHDNPELLKEGAE